MRAVAKYAWLLAAVGATAALGYFATYRWWESINNLFLLLPGIDKVAHFVIGFVIWVVLFRGLKVARIASGLRARLLIASVATVAIVLADEFSQTFASNRTVDLQDPLSGLAGAGLALALFGLCAWNRRIPVAVGALAVVAWTTSATYVRSQYFFEGILLEREARYEEAYERYKLALSVAPDVPAIYNNIAWLCIEYLERDFDKAIEWARTGVELDPSDYNVRDTLGWAYYKTGDLHQALHHVEIAARLAPDNPVIAEHLDELRRATGRR